MTLRKISCELEVVTEMMIQIGFLFPLWFLLMFIPSACVPGICLCSFYHHRIYPLLYIEFESSLPFKGHHWFGNLQLKCSRFVYEDKFIIVFKLLRISVLSGFLWSKWGNSEVRMESWCWLKIWVAHLSNVYHFLNLWLVPFILVSSRDVRICI